MSVAAQSPSLAGRASFVGAELDLPALGTALWRKKWSILVPTILVALVTLGVVQTITPRYLSESRVLIEGRDNVFLRPDADKDVDRNIVDEQAVTSQVQLILSRDLARDVIAKLKLGERPEFDPALSGVSSFKALLGMLGITKNLVRMTPEERVLEAYYDRLSVYSVEKSRVIVIDFLSEDPELAARVANAIAESYQVLQRQVRQDQARTAGQWLSGEIDQMRKKVAEAEGKVEAFRSKSNLLVGNNNTTLSAQQLGDLNTQLAAARAQKSDAEAKARLIREMLRSGTPIESSDVLNSELIRRLSEQRVTLRAQLAEQSSTLLDGHPRIKELKAQIADLERQIRGEAETIARSFENDAKLAGARLDSQVASLDQIKGLAAKTNEQDVELRALEREAKSQRDLLESYLAKYREATSRDTINSSPAEARVISRATVSNVPAYPKKLPTVLIATVATLVLCSGLVLTRALLSPPGDTLPARQMPHPAAAAETAVARDAVAADAGVRLAEVDPPAVGATVGSIEEVAEILRREGADGGPVAVLTAVRRLDTSLTALRLARTLAKGARVVLVGLGASDTAIKIASNDPSAGGLAELASGAASFRDIITKDKMSTLHLIASGRTATDRTLLLSSPSMAMAVVALERSYDYVVVDGGAVAEPEIEAIAELTPRALLVADVATDPATAATLDQLIDGGFEDVIVFAGARAGRLAAA